MPAPLTTFSRTPDPAQAPPGPADEGALWARSRLEGQLAVLGRLAEAGLEIAVALERQAQTQGRGEGEAVTVTHGDIALAYARVSRAVRTAIALQSKLMADFLTFGQEAARAASHADFLAKGARRELERTRRAGVERIVERIVRAETDDEAVCTLMRREAATRLDDDTLSCDLATAPFSEIVAAICRDLGLEPDWAVLAEEAWARAEIDAGRPGAPLAALGLDGEPPDIGETAFPTSLPPPRGQDPGWACGTVRANKRN